VLDSANGFFEWAGKAEASSPYFICLPSGEPLAFAACMKFGRTKSAFWDRPIQVLHDHHHGGSDSVRDIHNRMPLILNRRLLMSGLIQITRNLPKSKNC